LADRATRSTRGNAWNQGSRRGPVCVSIAYIRRGTFLGESSCRERDRRVRSSQL